MQTYYTSGFLYRKFPIQKMGEQLKHAEFLTKTAAGLVSFKEWNEMPWPA